MFYPPLLLLEVVVVVVVVAVFPFWVSVCFVFFALVIENEIRLIRVMATLPLRTAPLRSGCLLIKLSPLQPVRIFQFRSTAESCWNFDWYASPSAAVKAGLVTPP